VEHGLNGFVTAFVRDSFTVGGEGCRSDQHGEQKDDDFFHGFLLTS
jgi:hypothetical protein